MSNITHIVYQLPHELLNDLRLRILKNKEIFKKKWKSVQIEPSAQSFIQKLDFCKAVKNYAEAAIKIFRSCPIFLDFSCWKYFVHGCRPALDMPA